jgi:predicted methyltransferase
MSTRTSLGTIGVSAAILSCALAPAAHAQREQWQKVDEVLAALQFEEGDTIADIGAGDGFFSLRLSPLLGPTGKVFAVDIDEQALSRLEREAERASLTNVEIVFSETDDPRLRPNLLDGALIVISYHEFTEHRAMLAAIRRALKPGARLVIVDNVAWDPSSPRQTQVQRHHMDIRLVEGDLEEAGFEIVERRPDFVDTEVGGRRRRNWLLVATPFPPHHDSYCNQLNPPPVSEPWPRHSILPISTSCSLSECLQRRHGPASSR